MAEGFKSVTKYLDTLQSPDEDPSSTVLESDLVRNGLLHFGRQHLAMQQEDPRSLNTNDRNPTGEDLAQYQSTEMNSRFEGQEDDIPPEVPPREVAPGRDLPPGAAAGPASDNDSGCGIEEFSWVPAGLSPAQVHQYMGELPQDKVPLIGSVGQKYRLRQLLHQLPPHDNDARYCGALSELEQRELWVFSCRRARDSLGRAQVTELRNDASPLPCKQCSVLVERGQLLVMTGRLGVGVVWHPRCFICCICSELLVDLIYFIKGENIYCGRHHAETLKPRCSSCDEIIFSDECTEAEGRSWHMLHFSCIQCGSLLGGQRYVMRADLPYCCPCFEDSFADRCRYCCLPIRVDEGHMAHDGMHWHANEQCFSCCSCQRSLIGQPFLPRSGGIIYCTSCSFAEADGIEGQKSLRRRSASCDGDDEDATTTDTEALTFTRPQSDITSCSEMTSSGAGLKRDISTSNSLVEESEGTTSKTAGIMQNLNSRSHKVNRSSSESSASFIGRPRRPRAKGKPRHLHRYNRDVPGSSDHLEASNHQHHHHKRRGQQHSSSRSGAERKEARVNEMLLAEELLRRIHEDFLGLQHGGPSPNDHQDPGNETVSKKQERLPVVGLIDDELRIYDFPPDDSVSSSGRPSPPPRNLSLHDYHQSGVNVRAPGSGHRLPLSYSKDHSPSKSELLERQMKHMRVSDQMENVIKPSASSFSSPRNFSQGASQLGRLNRSSEGQNEYLDKYLTQCLENFRDNDSNYSTQKSQKDHQCGWRASGYSSDGQTSHNYESLLYVPPGQQPSSGQPAEHSEQNHINPRIQQKNSVREEASPRTEGYCSDIERPAWSWKSVQKRNVEVHGPGESLGLQSVQRYFDSTRDWDHCSTCSSSSDSEFDYFLDKISGAQFGGGYSDYLGSFGSPLRVCRQASAAANRKPHNTKQCVVS